MKFNLLDILNDLIEHSPDAIMILNTEGFYVYINDTAVTTFGTPKEEIIGKHFSIVNKLTPNSLTYCLEIFPDVIKGNTKVIKITAYNYKHEEMVMSANCKLINQNGIDYLYLILRDTTKEYLWEHEKGELLEYNELLVQTINQSGVGILITDPKLEDNPIIYTNDGFTNMTGYSKEEVLGKNCRFLQGPRTHHATVAKIRDGIQQEHKVHEEILNYRKDKSTFWNELTISPVKSTKGKIEYFIGIQRDITTRKTLEIELHNDLKLARNLQQRLLSKPITKNDLIINGFYKPSQELGGDLYKWIQISEGLYAIFIIDVMGHGISSSLLTVSLHTEIVSLLQRKIVRPTEVMDSLNKLVFNMFTDDSDSDLVKYYFTCVYLLVDTNEKKIEYINAGHPDFIIGDQEDQSFFSSTSIPVGLIEDVTFESRVLNYENGSEIVLYTDGLLEHYHMTKHDLADILQQKRVENLFNEDPRMPEDDICIVHIELR